jgi:hypothetical protein
VDLVVSFAGAAAAFAFFILGQAMLRAYERRLVHYNGLARLERVLNLQLAQTCLVVEQIPQMRAPVSDGQLLAALPQPILEPDDLFLDLLDIDLTNLLFDHQIAVQRANSDIRNIRSAYSDLKNSYLGGSIGQDVYVASAAMLVSKLEELAVGLSEHESLTLNLLSVIRLRLAEPRPLSFKVVGGLSRLRLRPLTAEAVARERAILESECAESTSPYSSDRRA